MRNVYLTRPLTQSQGTGSSFSIEDHSVRREHAQNAKLVWRMALVPRSQDLRPNVW